MTTDTDDLERRLRNDVCLFSKLDWQDHVALAREAADTIAKLRDERDELLAGDRGIAELARRWVKAEKRVKSLEAESAALREALSEAVEVVRPFAERAVEIDKVAAIRRHAHEGSTPVRFTDLRRARAFIAKYIPAQGGE